MKCPIDNTPLSQIVVQRKFLREIKLDICNTCQGVWVDKDELSPLMQHFSVDSDKTYQTWLQTTKSGKTLPRDFWQEGERACPKDSSLMSKHYIGTANQVGINECPTCLGFWFDGSELYAIAQANEPDPTLDRAVASALNSLETELSDNYDGKVIAWWNVYNTPSAILPHLTRMIFNVMADYIARRKS